MSAKWSVQPVKGTVADADVFLIIDSEAGPTENKQVLFSTLALAAQTPWRGDIDAATFNLDNLTSVDLNNALGTNPIIFALQSASESTVVLGSNFQISSGFIDIAEIATPTNPAADVGRLYVKDDGGITTLFFRDSAGTETDLQGGTSPLTTQGDLFGRDATGDQRFAIGSPGQQLTVNTGQPTNLQWVTPASRYTTIEDEGTPLAQETTIDFVGAGVTATADTGKTIVTIPGSGGGGHVIEDEGSPLTQRAALNFVGAGVVVTDDVGNDASVVTISGSTSPLTTQGDLFGRDLTADARIPIGSPGQVLTMSTIPGTLIRWETPASPSGYATIQDEGIPLPQQNTIDFVGAGVVATDGTGVTTVTISGVGGIAGHVIQDESTTFTQRANLRFLGDVTVTDVGASDRTDIAILSTTPLTTKGDILGFDTNDSRIPVGSPGQVLTANTGAALGVIWATPAGATGYQTIEDEGTPLAQEIVLDFVGAGVTVTAGTGETIVTIPGSSSPLTTAGDLFGWDTGDARVPIGSPGQMLTVVTANATQVGWTTPFSSPLTTLGDIMGFSTVDARIPIGSPGQVLTVQTAQPTSVNWVTPTASPVSVIGHVDVVTPTNSVSVVLTETISFDDTVTDIELVGSFSLAVADTVAYFINSLTQTAYDSTFVFVSNTGTVTGQNTAQASVGWSTGKSFAAGLSAAIKLRLNIGDSISLNSRPTGEIWETPGDTTGDLYRAGRVSYSNTPAPTSITSIQITTAGGQNFEAGSSFTVIKRTTS